MFDSKLIYFKKIDSIANEIANKLVDEEPVTIKILETISEIYKSAKVEHHFKDFYFENAYHSPITGDVEFFISRILYYYSSMLKLGWKILLRKQESRTAPDIRLELTGKCFAIIEIKVKAGWIQPFLSAERFASDKLRLANGKTNFDPDNLIRDSRHQLNKYMTTFDLKKENVFMLLPTLKLVHRKKYKAELEDYYDYFATTSLLPKENLILMSNNKFLDLSNVQTDLSPNNNFENMINKLLLIANNKNGC